MTQPIGDAEVHRVMARARAGVKRAVWAVLVLTVVLLIAVGASIGYTIHYSQQLDHRWCTLLTSLDNTAAPPTSERAVQIQRQIHELRLQLGCK